MISVIIPTFNEEACIEKTITYLKSNVAHDQAFEVLVCDGGSTDSTIQLADAAGAKTWVSPLKGRSAQMNFGASKANGQILYFLHADTIPPVDFAQHIIDQVNKGYQAGCFTLSFDEVHWFLKANCWFTSFDFNYFRFGDQSLFITKDVFLKAGGFCEKHTVMEDQEIIRRIKRITKFKIINKPVITSARKYLENGIYKTQGVFFLIFLMYRLGYSQTALIATYRKLIQQDKV